MNYFKSPKNKIVIYIAAFIFLSILFGLIFVDVRFYLNAFKFVAKVIPSVILVILLFIFKELRNRYFESGDNRQKKEAPSFEKLNIYITLLFSAISVYLTFQTLQQKQDIIGMNELLIKQDSILSELAKKRISDEYISQPIISTIGELKFIKTNDTTCNVKIVIVNSGERMAESVHILCCWVDISNNKVIENISYNTTNSSISLPPNNNYIVETRPHVISNEHRNSFPDMYLIIKVSYIDPLMNSKKIVYLFKKQDKYIDDIIRLYDVNDQDLTILKSYILNRK